MSAELGSKCPWRKTAFSYFIKNGRELSRAVNTLCSGGGGELLEQRSTSVNTGSQLIHLRTCLGRAYIQGRQKPCGFLIFFSYPIVLLGFFFSYGR